jgi:hypothetical protein
VNVANSYSATCSGDLQSRATQSGQQSSGQSQTAASAQLCSNQTAASTNPGTGGDDSGQAPGDGSGTPLPRDQTAVADLSPGAKHDYSDGAYSGEDTVGRDGGARVTPPGTASEIGAIPDGYGGLAQLPTRQSYGAGGGGSGSGGGFAGTPGLGAGEEEAVAQAAIAKAGKAGDGGTLGGGGGGRRYIPLRRPAGLGLPGEEGVALAATGEKEEENPDLKRFLPHLQKRRLASLAAMGIHSPEANFFTKVHERYVALQHTLETDAAVVQLAPAGPSALCRVTRSEMRHSARLPLWRPSRIETFAERS